MHVPDEVRELVAKKHYRHVSMSLMPDRVTLRHVALLGAAQPAIDGLQAVEFKNGAEAITVDFAATTQGDDSMTEEELQRQVGQLQAQLEALKNENAGLKKERDAHKQDKDKADAAKSEAEQKAEKASADFAAYRGKIEGERREARVAELVKAGKVKPAERADVLDFAVKLAGRDETVDFAAPDGTKKSISLEERYFRDLEARPVDERFADFAAPPVHVGHAGDPAPAYDPAKMAAKM